MIEKLYEGMGIPDSCLLGKTVFKKLFHENIGLGATDKKIFRDDIDTVIWQYTLKPNTIPIQPYENGNREYLEIAVLQVDLKTQRRTSRIAEIIHRAIPYPVVVVFDFGKMCALSLAHKRFSQAEKEAIVAEDIIISEWIDLSALTPVQQAFLDSMAVTMLTHTHFLSFYSALLDRVIAMDCARLNGEYRVESTEEKRTVRRERLSACRELEGRIAEYKAAIKRETQFNRQVELNTKIKELEKQLKEMAALL